MSLQSQFKKGCSNRIRPPVEGGRRSHKPCPGGTFQASELPVPHKRCSPPDCGRPGAFRECIKACTKRQHRADYLRFELESTVAIQAVLRKCSQAITSAAVRGMAIRAPAMPQIQLQKESAIRIAAGESASDRP